MLIPMMIALMAEQVPVATPGAIFEGLTGSCWRTQMSGGMTDTHCFTTSDGGKLVMDLHKVRSTNDAVVYEGVTLYRVDGGQVVYSYFNSPGAMMTGTASRDGDRLYFTFEGQAGIVWKLNPDGYDVVSGQETKHFERIGAAPADGL